MISLVHSTSPPWSASTASTYTIIIVSLRSVAMMIAWVGSVPIRPTFETRFVTEIGFELFTLARCGHYAIPRYHYPEFQILQGNFQKLLSLKQSTVNVAIDWQTLPFSCFPRRRNMARSGVLGKAKLFVLYNHDAVAPQLSQRRDTRPFDAVIHLTKPPQEHTGRGQLLLSTAFDLILPVIFAYNSTEVTDIFTTYCPYLPVLPSAEACSGLSSSP